MADGIFPDGKQVAVVTSWDDGTTTDRLMLRMLEQYGYKGTFYVCPELIGTGGRLDADGLRNMAAAGHEIGSHSLDHPHLETLAPQELQRQLTESKKRLEALFDAPIPSFAYPFGLGNGQEAVVEAVRAAGYTSARTTKQAERLTAQDLAASDLMRLPVTAYFDEDFLTIQDKWEAVNEVDGGIFHLWGHSKDLGEDKNDWVDFECILGFLGGISNVWYCTVGELISAVRQAGG